MLPLKNRPRVMKDTDMSYWRYWQLNGIPFGGNQGHPLFRGSTVEEAIARIEFLITNRRGLGLLVGPSGVGKSSVLRYCASHPPVSSEISNLSATRLSVLGLQSGELLSELATRWTGVRRGQSPTAAWSLICDYFQGATRERFQNVLFIDDAESCSTPAELDLARLLSNSFPLTVVVAAASETIRSISPWLFDRTDLQIELPGWEVVQIAEFLDWTGQRLGRQQPIFTSDAVEAMHQFSQGRPRRIVQLADLALVAGAVSQMDAIDADCIQQVAWELPRTSAA
jgi:type II secretory pathway predicted ATPase ExeA